MIFLHLLELLFLLLIFAQLKKLQTKLTKLMATQTQLANDLRTTKAQIDKIGTETAATLQKVKDLETALANSGSVAPEVQTALDELKASAQAADDLVPDSTDTTAPASTGGISSDNGGTPA